jgi:hypothetical protein
VLGFSCSKSLRDNFYNLFLFSSWIIDCKNILLNWIADENPLNSESQVYDMDHGHNVIPRSIDIEFFRILTPGLLIIRKETSLPVPILNSSADHIRLDARFLYLQTQCQGFQIASVFINRQAAPRSEVLLRKIKQLMFFLRSLLICLEHVFELLLVLLRLELFGSVSWPS